MRKGFTLIELLAVIIILGVIAVIVVPTVSTIIKKAKVKSFVASAQGIVKTAEIKAGENDMDGLSNALITLPSLTYKGKRYETGSISFDDENEVAIAIWDTALKVCAIKDYDDSVVAVDKTITEQADCTITSGPVNLTITSIAAIPDYTRCVGTVEYFMSDVQSEVVVTLSDSTTRTLSIEWIENTPDWDRGTMYGNLTLVPGIINPSNLRPQVRLFIEC